MSVEIASTGNGASNAEVCAEATKNSEALKKSCARLKNSINPQRLPKPPLQATKDCKDVIYSKQVNTELKDFFYHSIWRALRRKNR